MTRDPRGDVRSSIIAAAQAMATAAAILRPHARWPLQFTICPYWTKSRDSRGESELASPPVYGKGLGVGAGTLIAPKLATASMISPKTARSTRIRNRFRRCCAVVDRTDGRYWDRRWLRFDTAAGYAADTTESARRCHGAPNPVAWATGRLSTRGQRGDLAGAKAILVLTQYFRTGTPSVHVEPLRRGARLDGERGTHPG